MKIPTNDTEAGDNIREARSLIRSSRPNLSLTEETDALTRFIVDSPQYFLPTQVALARRWTSSSIYGQPPEEFTTLDAVKSFVDEFGNQAVKINENVNPFAEGNRTTFVAIGVLVALVAVGVFAYTVGNKIPVAK